MTGSAMRDCFGIIVGSSRSSSHSARVGKCVETILGRTGECETFTLDLAAVQLPLWDGRTWDNDPEILGLWKPISERISAANAFVFISPEWGGMATPALKNFLLYCDSDELAHKPGLIVSVSSGRGGAYPVAELRMSGYKNTHICWIPEHVIVREVEALGLDVHEPLEPIVERLGFALKLLRAYASVLRQMRSIEGLELGSFPYGM